MQEQSLSYKILIIEDSKFFSKLLAKSLSKNGHHTAQAYSLREGMEQLDTKSFDYIILDLILPDGEGDQVIDALPKNIRHKVIVLSASNDIQRRDYLFEAGILDYFSKSNPLEMILKDINDLLYELKYNPRINILVVDDSAFMRRMIKNSLAPKRYNIFEANCAETGLEILKNNNINLLLLDYEMPNTNGAMMLEKIKSQTNFLSLPVIMISSKNDKDIIARVLKHGANDFIHKPFSTEELLLKCNLQIKAHIHFQLLEQKEKQLKEVVEKLSIEKDAKSQFLANMSHEIRTPLNAILGFVDLLKEHTTDQKSQEYLDVVDSSSQHLLGVVNDILDLSKIESKKIELENEAFDVYKLFSETVALFKAVAKSNEIKLQLEIDSNIPHALYGDALRIKQVVSNLLSNAIKFTPQYKQVTLQLSYPDSRLRVEVIDEGIGIASDKLEKIFEEFSQADSSTSRKYGGTGLGLSISSKLVALMHGKLHVKSTLHKGSTFYFILPLEKAKAIQKIEKISDETKIFNKKVLLVEDNKANQMYMEILLKKLHLEFEIAKDGLEAIEMFKNSSYDLILMDENMPNLNGLEALKQLVEIEKTTQSIHTPVIALTANALKGDKERFLEAGMDAYLTKPVNKEKLVEAISNVLHIGVLHAK